MSSFRNINDQKWQKNNTLLSSTCRAEQDWDATYSPEGRTAMLGEPMYLRDFDGLKSMVTPGGFRSSAPAAKTIANRAGMKRYRRFTMGFFLGL